MGTGSAIRQGIGPESQSNRRFSGSLEQAGKGGRVDHQTSVESTNGKSLRGKFARTGEHLRDARHSRPAGTVVARAPFIPEPAKRQTFPDRSSPSQGRTLHSHREV